MRSRKSSGRHPANYLSLLIYRYRMHSKSSESAIMAGACAVSLAAPRGALAESEPHLVRGRLYGASIFPQALLVVKELAAKGIPVIGAGGVYSLERAADAGQVRWQSRWIPSYGAAIGCPLRVK